MARNLIMIYYKADNDTKYDDDNNDTDDNDDADDKWLTLVDCCRLNAVGSNNVLIVVCSNFNKYTVATSSILVPCI